MGRCHMDSPTIRDPFHSPCRHAAYLVEPIEGLDSTILIFRAPSHYISNPPPSFYKERSTKLLQEAPINRIITIRTPPKPLKLIILTKWETWEEPLC